MSSKFDNGPGYEYTPIIPNDLNLLKVPIRGFYVGVGGDVAVKDIKGDTVIFVGLLAGHVYWLGAAAVLGTGTTATAIIGIQ
jgi:hypothetical protein